MTSTFKELLNAENLAIEGTQVPEWFARPYQLVSLLDMIPFNLRLFYMVSRLLETDYHITASVPSVEKTLHFQKDKNLQKKLSEALEKRPQEVIGALQTTLQQCNELGFEFSAGYIAAKIKELEENYTTQSAVIVLDELQGHIEREISRHLFMQIPHDKADYWGKKKLFGAKVYKNFRSTREDVIEAGNCFAAGRN